MSKNTNFSVQPVFNQIIKFFDKSEIKKIARKHNAERYVKKFTTYHHLIVMLYVTLEGFQSIREVILGLLSIPERSRRVGCRLSVCSRSVEN
jgi:hypothetical protein